MTDFIKSTHSTLRVTYSRYTLNNDPDPTNNTFSNTHRHTSVHNYHTLIWVSKRFVNRLYSQLTLPEVHTFGNPFNTFVPIMMAGTCSTSEILDVQDIADIQDIADTRLTWCHPLPKGCILCAVQMQQRVCWIWGVTHRCNLMAYTGDAVDMR